MDIKTIIAAGVTAAIVSVGAIWVAVHQLSDPVSPPVTQPAEPSNFGRAQADSEFCAGGVCRYSFAQQMTQNASTTCNWQTPAATSTLKSFDVRFTLASTSAAAIEMGKSVNPMSTTTLIGTLYTIPAGQPATIQGSTTPSLVTVLGPSTWLAVKISQGTSGTVPTGTCNFVVETLP